MTIAACYVGQEGVVFGADSTSTVNVGGGHYFNYTQKVFELGTDSTLGVVTWGLGNLGAESHRTLFARVADRLAAQPPNSVLDVANLLAAEAWTSYTGPALLPLITRCQALGTKAPFQPGVAPAAGARTSGEENEFRALSRNLLIGYCVGGHVLPSRDPYAHVVMLDPKMAQPTVAPAALTWNFWGVPNMISRLILGVDDTLKDSILASGHWQGTPADLDAVLAPLALDHPILPIRDAIDFVHSCIASTIKGIKFSAFQQTCGGPIEIAVVTTDRRFRWVRHKSWDAAINDGAVQ